MSAVIHCLSRSWPRAPDLIGARRTNAAKSTGPRTAGGKARVRFNAVKHGRRSLRFWRFLKAVQFRPRRFFRLSERIRLPIEEVSPLERVMGKAWRERERAHAWEVSKGLRSDEQSE